MDVVEVVAVMFLVLTCGASAPTCGKGANIGTPQGVQTESLNGSRVELGPLTGKHVITSGSTITVSFRPQVTSGLVFAALDSRSNDMVATYILDGHLAFARRCDKFYYLGVGKRLEMNRWYTVSYRHSTRGGEMHLDGSNHHRKYHMWGCRDFTQLFFGGMPDSLKRKVYWEAATASFGGCIRDMQLDGTFPDLTPRYHLVSSCLSDEELKRKVTAARSRPPFATTYQAH